MKEVEIWLIISYYLYSTKVAKGVEQYISIAMEKFNSLENRIDYIRGKGWGESEFKY
ncbi:hypothetical protein [Clostridium sp. Cult2]|uniref:hypothetical protein n=1 Tax=Clostridium sp. Cult2 TaxID=2079003 RepID=UPI001F2785D8|nr:hypothetical protein [Clostridium sp. Cult2]